MIRYQETPLRGPKPPGIELTDAERQQLDQLIRRHTTPQQRARRRRIILAAAAGLNNAHIARHLQVTVDTVRLWRRRWLGLQPVPVADLSVEERLTDAPRPGQPVRSTAAQVGQMVALAGEAPPPGDRPISQWTGRELADEIVKRGIVDRISGRHAARLLNRGPSNRI
jgi:putative transposase